MEGFVYSTGSILTLLDVSSIAAIPNLRPRMPCYTACIQWFDLNAGNHLDQRRQDEITAKSIGRGWGQDLPSRSFLKILKDIPGLS